MYSINSFMRVALIWAALLPMTVLADVKDVTSQLAGAECDEASAAYWQLTGNQNGVLECDTWSARGDKDGSMMPTPFMEYWVNQQEGTLSDATVRHQPVTGLPAGSYRVQMHIRCYDESGQRTELTGVSMYVNGQTLSACQGEGVATGTYNGQTYTNATLTVELTLAEGEALDLGLNIQGANCNWVAWRDIRLWQTDAKPNPVGTGTYYLQNIETGLWVNAGLYAGTQAVLGQHPLAVNVTGSSTSSDKMLDFGFANGAANHYMGISDNIVSLETGLQTWTVTTDDNGISTLKNQNGCYLAYAADNMALTATNSNRASDAAAQWRFVSRNQMMQQLLTAQEGQPQDATFLIDNPRFDRHYQGNAWEGSDFAIGGEEGLWGNPGNLCAEVWNNTFDVKQVLTNIPNGHYRLTAQGYYRYNNNWNNTNSVALSTHRNGTEQLYATIYANSYGVQVQSIASELDNIAEMGLNASESGLPYSMTEASHAFTAGLYNDNEVEIDVTDHTLTIGICKYQQDGCDWTIWDNFALELLSAGDNTGYDPTEKDSDDFDFDSATPDNPLDITALITNADFSAAKGWKGSPDIGGSDNRNAQKFYTDFDVYQILTDLPNGWYRLSVKGYYRYGDSETEQQKSYWGSGWEENDANNVYAMYTIPYAVISHRLGLERRLARLYGNHTYAPLPTIFHYAQQNADDISEWDWTETEFGWIPWSQDGAAEAFRLTPDSTVLTVPVTDGTLRIGVKKQRGYKNDLAVWDDFRLSYLGKQDFQLVEDIQLPASLNMNAGEVSLLQPTLLPADKALADSTLEWTSSNSNVATVSRLGQVKAVGPGTATITARAYGSNGGSLTAQTAVQVAQAGSDPSQLKITEIQVSNVDMFLDPSYNYGGWVEVYNPTTKSISLNGLWIGLTAENQMQQQLNKYNGYVPAKGYQVIWFDHHAYNNGNIDDKLDMDGGTVFLSKNDGTLITSQAYPAAVSRTSYALVGNRWGITAQPTPGKAPAEDTELLDAIASYRLPEPVVSHPSQLFNAPFTATVDIPDGATLRYTTDGSAPTATSAVSKDGTFAINQTTTLRLRLFQQGWLPSAVKTCSYIQHDKDYMLPVLSVVSAPENFYNDTIGVFVTGVNGAGGSGIDYPCNWNQDWDRPVAFNYFTPDGQTEYSQETTLSRFGGWSRAWYPYNFKLNAQAQYEGRKFMEYPFFPLKKYNKHKVLQVRNGGNDLLCRIRDAALQHIILSSGLHLDCQDYRPVHSFINGQYQGMVNLREPSNKHFAYANYGIDTDMMDQMELTGSILMKVGTDEAFQKWITLAASATSDAKYKQICELVDVEEFANYMAVQIFLGGDDWPTNNCKAFKGNDGKFHIVLFDIDQALRFDAYAFTRLNNNRNCPLINIFCNMMRNQQFAQLFRTCFSIVAGSVFDPTRSQQILDDIVAEMEPALNLEGASTEPTAGYMRAVMTETRKQTMLQALGSWRYAYASGSGQKVTLSTSLPEARLTINGVTVPTGYFDGLLYNNNIIEALAPEGYTFKGWQRANGTMLSTNAQLNIDGKGTLALTAVFQPMANDSQMMADIAVPVKVNELSAGNSVYMNDRLKKNDWIELYNTTDTDLDVAGLYLSDDPDQPMKYQIPDGGDSINTIIPAKGHLIVWCDKLEGTTQMHASFKLSNSDQQMVMLTSSSQFVGRNLDYFNTHPQMRAFADGMSYNMHRGDQSIGRYPDGGRLFYEMWRPTCEMSNVRLSTDAAAGEDLCLMNQEPGLFAIDMQQGWNWVSHPLLAGMAVDQLPAETQRVDGITASAVRKENNIWGGQLRWMNTAELYKVSMTAPATYSTNETFCNPSLPQQLQQGWNWVGYPAGGTQSLTDALLGFIPDDGDAIMGQNGFSIYQSGRWQGTLSSIETGKGYQYRSVGSKTLTFHKPEVVLNMRRAHLRHLAAGHDYGYNRHAHPAMMGLVARLTSDGTDVSPERYTLVAYSDKECRGVAQQVDQHLWTSICGEGGEKITFKAIDNETGITYHVVESLSFAPDIQGSSVAPITLTLGDVDDTAIDIVSNGTGKAVDAYYRLDGTRINGTPAKGLYIMQQSSGHNRKAVVK